MKLLVGNKRPFQNNHSDFRNLIIKLISSIGIFATDIFSSPKGFTSMLSIEKSLGVRSSIMLSGLSHEESYEQVATDPIYDISDKCLRKSLEMAKKYGFPIGMHPSIATAPYVERYREQKRYINENLGISVRSLRHHYWNVSRKDTSDALVAIANAGIEFDSSLSFYGHSGKANFFRRSVALPFTPFHILQNQDIGLIELPPTLMDGWLDKDLSSKKVLQHIKIVGKQDGLVVLDWHGKMFNNRWFLRYGKVYISVLKKLVKQPNIWLTNIEEVGDWWKHRTSELSS